MHRVRNITYIRYPNTIDLQKLCCAAKSSAKGVYQGPQGSSEAARHRSLKERTRNHVCVRRPTLRLPGHDCQRSLGLDLPHYIGHRELSTSTSAASHITDSEVARRIVRTDRQQQRTTALLTKRGRWTVRSSKGRMLLLCLLEACSTCAPELVNEFHKE